MSDILFITALTNKTVKCVRDDNVIEVFLYHHNIDVLVLLKCPLEDIVSGRSSKFGGLIAISTGEVRPNLIHC